MIAMLMKVMNDKRRQTGIFLGDILTFWTVIKLLWTGHVDFPVNFVSHTWSGYQTQEVYWTWDVLIDVDYEECSVLFLDGWCLLRKLDCSNVVAAI